MEIFARGDELGHAERRAVVGAHETLVETLAQKGIEARASLRVLDEETEGVRVEMLYAEEPVPTGPLRGIKVEITSES